jgi:hypothetical protein
MARAPARRFMADQHGTGAIGAAAAALALDPLPADGFHAGQYHRLRVGDYRIVYVIEDELIAVNRVDRLSA